ncbi:hypothetical protein SFB5_173G0, partial [Candidatus Arthromitus sp. SFB-5]
MFDWFFNSILIGNASSSVSGK